MQLPAETSSNWAGLPSMVINHPAPTGTATLNSAFGGDWLTRRGAVRQGRCRGRYWQPRELELSRRPTRLVVKPDDFNGNNQSDILWQHDSGLPAIWLMNGFNTTAEAVPGGSNPGPTWHIKDAGDFNDDGRADILWQNDNGTARDLADEWHEPDGAGSARRVQSGAELAHQGTGDFNFDGKSDILWQNDTAGRDLADGWHELIAQPARRQSGTDLAVKGPATSTTTAGPTSCGRTTTGRPRSG